MTYMKTYNPCDDCQYSYSKNNQESGWCKACEFMLLRDDLEKARKLALTECDSCACNLLDERDKARAEVKLWIERYQGMHDVAIQKQKDKQQMVANEAIKEFAERLKEKPIKCKLPLLGLTSREEILNHFDDIMMQIRATIDNLTKEMTEGEEGEKDEANL